MRKVVFGRTVEFELSNPLERRILMEELRHYPSADREAPVDFHISDAVDGTATPLARNPAIHTVYADGFLADFGNTRVRLRFSSGQLRRAEYASPNAKHALIAAASKVRSVQYMTNTESVGQRLHELVLVPSALLDEERVVFHAAGLVAPSGRAVLLGGTGGVGKTSTQLYLCRQAGFGFLADDIAVAGDAGEVFPNFAYPKIYAYNVVGNDDLGAVVLGRRPVLDRLHWYLRSRYAMSWVRRRMDPATLYGSLPTAGAPLACYIILMRSNVVKPEFRAISPDVAAHISANVMRTEYQVFFRHLDWQKVNTAAHGTGSSDVVPSVEDVLGRQRERTTRLLTQANCEALHVPLTMSHTQFLAEVAPRIADRTT